MGQLVGVLLGTVIAVGAFFLIFWGINKTIELAPTQWALFLGVVGLLIGLVLGAFLNANAFGGGLATVLGGGAVGAVLGALFGWLRPPSIAERKRFSEAAQPWVFIAPALLFVTVGLVIPTIRTGILAFKDRTSENWVGFENFSWIFTNDEMLELETLGPLVGVPSQRSVDHIENWSLHRNVKITAWTDDALDRVLLPLLR